MDNSPPPVLCKAHLGLAQERQSEANWHVLALLLIVLLYYVIRFNIVDIPLNRDEGGFAFFGRLFSQGGTLYQDAFDHKPPGIWILYSLLFRIVPMDALHLHVALHLYNMVTLLVLFALALSLFGISAGLWTALIFAVTTSSPQVEGFSASAEMFMLLPLVGSFLLSVKGVERNSWILFFLSGLLAAMAFWIKQPSLAISTFIAAYILWVSWDARSRDESWWKRSSLGLLRVSVFGAAFVSFSLGLCGYFMYLGVWDNFIYWSFTHSLDYAGAGSTDQFIRQVSERLKVTALGNPITWVLAVGTALIVPFLKRKEGLIVLGFLGASFVTACHSQYMYRHYMALLCPAVALSAGFGTSMILDRMKPQTMSRRLVTVLIVAALVLVPLLIDRHYYFFRSPIENSRAMFGRNPFPESSYIAKYLAEHTEPSEKIAILGSEPQILVLAQRDSATRHIFFYQVVGQYKRSKRFQQEVIQDLETSLPRYSVLIQLSASWLVHRPTAEAFVNQIKVWLTQNYSLERALAIDKNSGKFLVGDAKDMNNALFAKNARIFIFKRKDTKRRTSQQ